MAIDVTYKEVLTEDYIKTKLIAGEEVTSSEMIDYLEYLNTVDLTVPQFNAPLHYVTYGEDASADKFKDTFRSIREDVKVLYREMLQLSDNAIRAYERWNVEAGSIEKKLIDLEDHLDNLLLITQDTDGYYSTLLENFTDATQVDLNESDCMIDLRLHQVTLQPTGGISTRVFLNNIDESKDVSFRVRSTANFLGRTDMHGSVLKDVFVQGVKGWWTTVTTTIANPLTCELDVKLATEKVAISKIFLELHDSVQSAPVQITPLYTTDGTNWQQFNTNTFSQEVRTSAVFSFPETEVLWVKFLLTKEGPDPGSGIGVYTYQFGFKEIIFYQEGFTANTTQTLISKPLFVADADGNPIDFSKIALQVCERVETNTKIRYYITTSNDPVVPLNSDPVWVPIAPVTVLNSPIPTVLDVGDMTDFTFGETEYEQVDDEIVKASYQGVGATGNLVNPAKEFYMLSESAGDIVSTLTSNNDDQPRYGFRQSNERILNYQLHSNVNIATGSLKLFRNTGVKGLDHTLASSRVRKVLRGWGFEDPWYYTVIEILAPEGIVLDVGDSPINIDDILYTGKVSNTVLTGKSKTSSGIHYVRVHKDNWKHVTHGLNSLAELQAADSLYPYNHKLLIEGYEYGVSYPAIEPKVYAGVDLFAEYLMKEVGVFDFVQNLNSDQYNLFALDEDATGCYTGGDNPSTVFLYKVDDKNPDFQNERFVIRFRLVNELRKYLRFRADLSTTDATVTPALTSYKLKLG